MSNSDLRKKIETLIEEVNTTHRYSMSRIYALYNEAFDTNEKPQSCASCLIRKVRDLQIWLNNNKEVVAVMGEDEEGNTPAAMSDEVANDAAIAQDAAEKTPRKRRKNGSAKE